MSKAPGGIPSAGAPAPQLTILVPAYNEADRLQETLSRLIALPGLKGPLEIIVVDDGTTDRSAAVVSDFSAHHPAVRLVLNSSNQGKGFSVRRGFEEARGEMVVFTDADLAAPPAEIEKLLRAIESGSDIAIASRALNAPDTQVIRTRTRALIAKTFAWLTGLILGLPYRDAQCGLKAFRRASTQLLFHRQKLRRYAFDAELLFLAGKMRLAVAEVAVNWRQDPRSKVRLVRDGTRMLIDLLRVRWWWLRGAYRIK